MLQSGKRRKRTRSHRVDSLPGNTPRLTRTILPYGSVSRIPLGTLGVSCDLIAATKMRPADQQAPLVFHDYNKWLDHQRPENVLAN